jgi:predicted enzyme related to lactoylglutathione lyase
MTADPSAAVAFYTDVVGWKTEPFGGSHYLMWVGSQGPLGGVMALDAEAKKMGAQPQWTSHVEVTDVDKAVASVRKLGGRVHVEPADIPTVGRFAVIADPQGASICVFKGDKPMAIHDASKSGEICWAELMTTDHQAALGFYGELFGWKKIGEHDMGAMGVYVMFGVGTAPLGGMFTKAKDDSARPQWRYYIETPDLSAALARAKAKGAEVLRGPMEVPGGAHVAQLRDPQGVAIALHQLKPAKG